MLGDRIVAADRNDTARRESDEDLLGERPRQPPTANSTSAASTARDDSSTNGPVPARRRPAATDTPCAGPHTGSPRTPAPETAATPTRRTRQPTRERQHAPPEVCWTSELPCSRRFKACTHLESTSKEAPFATGHWPWPHRSRVGQSRA